MAFHNSKIDFNLKNTKEQVENPMLTRLNSIKVNRRPSFITPTENEADTQVLMFSHTTKAQERTRKRQQPIKLEPLVSSKTSTLVTFGYRGSCKIALGNESISRLTTKKE